VGKSRRDHVGGSCATVTVTLTLLFCSPAALATFGALRGGVWARSGLKTHHFISHCHPFGLEFISFRRKATIHLSSRGFGALLCGILGRLEGPHDLILPHRHVLQRTLIIYSTALVAGRTARSCRRRCARPSRARSRGPPSAPPRPGAAGHLRRAPRSFVQESAYVHAVARTRKDVLVVDAPAVHPLAPPLVPALIKRLQLVGGQRFRARPERRQRLKERRLALAGRREELGELGVGGR
jgi:hypothetical protein